jgi:hypothetical protein
MYKYDFMTRRESAVVGVKEYVINEMMYSPDGKETDVTCFNIIFADRFGYSKSKDKNMKEANFLHSQFVIVQEYIEHKETAPW